MGMLVSSNHLYRVLHLRPRGAQCSSRTERVKIRVGDWRCGLQEEPTPRLSLYPFQFLPAKRRLSLSFCQWEGYLPLFSGIPICQVS